MPDPLLSIFARWPEPGAAKTRLIPDFGPEGAAAIYRKLLAHTVEVARASGVAFELRVTGAEPQDFRARLGEDLAGELARAGVSPPVPHVGVEATAAEAQTLLRSAPDRGRS